MRLFFSGSLGNVPTKRQESFKKAASDLGREAARREHVPLLHSEKRSTIDYHVVAGLRNLAKHRRTKIEVEIHRGIRDEDVFRGIAELEIKHRPYRWVDDLVDKRLGARAGAVVAADAVVLMGGGRGTEMVGRLAADLGRPVIAIGAMGGAAEMVYIANEPCYLQHPDVSPLMRVLTSDWHQDSAGAVLDICEILADKHSYFLSYAHKNVQFADYVETLLRRVGAVIYRDERELRPGDPLWKNIKEGIRIADTFVGLWSYDAKESDWCPRELAFALKSQKDGPRPRRVVLIQLDDAPLPPKSTGFLQLPGHSRSALGSSVNELLTSEHGSRGALRL